MRFRCGNGSGLPWASEIDGAMHACGHGLHVAVLVGDARLGNLIYNSGQGHNQASRTGGHRGRGRRGQPQGAG
jgi:hypothetical protein